jgi:S-DNA-T family DNA segregation ATPase FtsK/SpoIIIE
MGKLYQWMRRLQQFLDGEETEKQHYEETEKNEQVSHTYGRVESEKRKTESKVMYQYPKSGQFRFPIIEDQPIRRKRKENVKPEPVRPKRKEETVRQKQSESTNSTKPEFKLSSIPSPVYGFMERETTKSIMGDNLSVLPFEKKDQQQKHSDIMEKVLERAEDKSNENEEQLTSPIYNYEIQQSTKDSIPSFKQTVEAENKTHQKVNLPQQQLDSIYKLVDSRLSIEQENEVEQITADLQKELTNGEREVASSVEATFSLDEVMTEEKEKASLEQVELPSYEEKRNGFDREEEVAEEEEEVSSEQVEHPLYEEKRNGFDREEEVAEEEEEVSLKQVEHPFDKEPMFKTSPKGAANDNEPAAESMEKPRTSESETKEGRVVHVQDHKPKKAAIPFNVMMLPQDKRKQRSSNPSVIPRQEAPESNYTYPSIQLLNYPELQEQDDSDWLKEQSEILEETLLSFSVDAKVVLSTKGPSVTRFEIQPGRGVKVTKITGLTDDMKLALAAKDIRIEAPIPGKNTIGIEVPNRTSTPVFLREILRRNSFVRSESPLTVALGLDISGQPIVTDLKKMPHGLVAGATGSGKSVCINSVLVSLLFKATPDEVKLILIDPKMVELAPYNGLPHLVTPVITDAKQATAALKWVVLEMERRYELFSQKGVRDVGRYNELYSDTPDKPALPFILVVIDELADLMMVSPQEVEDSICRIAQKARACGIHLLLATQRPSVDVITGLIKANIPTRIAFSVSSQTDSRTILDMGGAERLLGRGDMLFHENGSPKPVRVQGTFVSDQEIEDVVAHVKKQRDPEYLFEADQLKHVTEEVDDEHFEEACYFIIEQGSASASSLQRKFRVGYNRAARLIDLMEERGIVSQAMGSKPRHVLVDTIELEEILYHQEG